MQRAFPRGLLDPEGRREVGNRIEDEIRLVVQSHCQPCPLSQPPQVRVVEVGCTKFSGSDEHPSRPGRLRTLDIGAHVVTDHDEIGRREAQGPRRRLEELRARLTRYNGGDAGGVLDRGDERAGIETQCATPNPVAVLVNRQEP